MRNKKIILIVFVALIILGIGYIIGNKNSNEKVVNTINSSKTVTTNSSTSEKTRASSSFQDVEETSESSRNLPAELLPYSDEEIEYARVWLAVMGEDYLEKVGSDFQFKLGISLIPKGEHIGYGQNHYDVTWPKDVIALYANATALGQVYYSSNFDGTVTVYKNMPSHWQYTQEQFEDEKFMTDFLNSIVNDTEIVSIPAGNPQKVKEIIERIE